MSAASSAPKTPKGGLTVPFIMTLRPPAGGGFFEVADVGETKALRVRVSAKSKTFYMSARWKKGATSASSRAIGDFAESERPGQFTLTQARDQVREWNALRKTGIDPAEKERADAEAAEAARIARERVEAAKNDNLFSVVMEDYLKRHVAGKRKAEQVAREMRADLLPSLKDKQLVEITRRDVVKIVDAIKDRGSMYQAHNVLGHLRTLFNWAIDRGVYGVETSPCDRMKPARVIGAKKARSRVLTDLEIAAFWRAAGKMTKYDRVRARKVDDINGAVFRLLLVTGQRKSEIAEMAWSELDMDRSLLTVPAERYKSDAVHTVPLSDMAMTIVRAVPRQTGEGTGDFVFSTTRGVKPVNGFSNATERLHRQMLLALRAFARMRGDDPKTVTLPHFVIHDVRRTVRTRLSGLRVADHVAELVIGHARTGLHGVYDRHSYDDEKREALDAWAAKLRTIIAPSPSNVVPIRRVS